MKVALAAARPGPNVNIDHDMPELYRALSEAGASVSLAHWDDPNLPWEMFDLVVIRSTWDYSFRCDEFLRWVDQTSRVTTILNQPTTIHWNADKPRYLTTLADEHIPVIPTRFIKPGMPIDLSSDQEFVVKPSVGGGSRLAARYSPADVDDAEKHVRALHKRDLVAMIQPYVHDIENWGERALVFFGGTCLHAIRKSPILHPGSRYDERREPHPGTAQWVASQQELSLAEQALSVAPNAGELLYGRVDVVGDPTDPMVIELELIEPNLFLQINPSSMTAVVDAIISAAKHAV